MIPSLLHRIILSACLTVLGAGNALAMNVTAVVKDDAGKPVKDAVLYAMTLNKEAPQLSKPADAVMDQVDKEFVPYVLPIQTGTIVNFPNHDNLRHQVYSISPAKRFQLPLYRNLPPAPILFDLPGVVALGCNIHDWMIAYIYVMDTPYFAKTREDGKAEIRNLPQGAYAVHVWHPLMKGGAEPPEKRITAAAGEETGKGPELSFRISLKPEWRPSRAPSSKGEDYR